jgi:cold shock protein
MTDLSRERLPVDEHDSAAKPSQDHPLERADHPEMVVLGLQRTAGNQAVARMLSGGASEAKAGPQQQEGTVKFFNTEKGYGFIAPATGGSHDVFVHFTSIVGTGNSRVLAEGQRVAYDVVNNPRHGAMAEQVRILPG